MRRLLISMILAFLLGASAISSPTIPQNQNSGKPPSNKNSAKSSNKNSTRSRGNRNTGTTTGPTSSQGNPNAKVWVNTDSGVYHCAGTRWYGKTKSGQYMTQKEALDKNFRADHGRACQ